VGGAKDKQIVFGLTAMEGDQCSNLDSRTFSKEVGLILFAAALVVVDSYPNGDYLGAAPLPRPASLTGIVNAVVPQANQYSIALCKLN
jgi:hypothetical protein